MTKETGREQQSLRAAMANRQCTRTIKPVQTTSVLPTLGVLAGGALAALLLLDRKTGEPAPAEEWKTEPIKAWPELSISSSKNPCSEIVVDVGTGTVQWDIHPSDRGSYKDPSVYPGQPAVHELVKEVFGNPATDRKRGACVNYLHNTAPAFNGPHLWHVTAWLIKQWEHKLAEYCQPDSNDRFEEWLSLWSVPDQTSSWPVYNHGQDEQFFKPKQEEKPKLKHMYSKNPIRNDFVAACYEDPATRDKRYQVVAYLHKLDYKTWGTEPDWFLVTVIIDTWRNHRKVFGHRDHKDDLDSWLHAMWRHDTATKKMCYIPYDLGINCDPKAGFVYHVNPVFDEFTRRSFGDPVTFEKRVAIVTRLIELLGTNHREYYLMARIIQHWDSLPGRSLARSALRAWLQSQSIEQLKELL